MLFDIFTSFSKSARQCFTSALILASLSLSPSIAQASVSAFGFALDETTVSEALSRGGTRSGTNKFSGGPMIDFPASALGFDGAKDTTLIFNPDSKLAAIIVTMNKNRFDSVLGYLKSKYALREKQLPFVGDKYARLGAPGVTIELDAPHMSFNMTLSYQLDTFVAAYKRIKAQEAHQTRQRESSQF